MKDLSEAFAALGLPEDASKEDIEKRYDLLLRQARSQQRRGEQIIDEALVHKAYNFILDIERKKRAEEFYEATYGKHKKYAHTAEKIDHFFQYYKLHVIGAIIVAIVIAFSIKGYLDQRAEKIRLANLPPASVSVHFFGEYNMYYEEPFDEMLVAYFPDWERIEADISFVPLEPRDEFEIAMLQKSVITLMSEKPEIFIMDRGNFEKNAFMGLFVKLDELFMGTNNLLTNPDQIVYAQGDDDLIEHAYGIDVTAKMAEVLPGLGREYIAGVSVHADENIYNALRFIKTFMK